MGNSGKSNNFCPKYMPGRFPSFLIAFAQIFPLLSARISHCFFPKCGQKQLEIRAKAMETFAWAKPMRKLGKRWDIFRAKIMEVLGNFTNCHIIFKILKDLASSTRIFSARNSQYIPENIVFYIRAGVL